MKHFILPVLLVLSPAPGLFGVGDHTADDSVNVVMDLDLNLKTHEEKRGGIVQDVRLYTSGGQSLIVWSDGKDRFVYPVLGNNHQTDALALIDPVTRGDMISYVFETEPRKSVRYAKFYQVVALQIRPSPARD